MDYTIYRLIHVLKINGSIPLVVASETGKAQTYTVLLCGRICLRTYLDAGFKGQAVAVWVL